MSPLRILVIGVLLYIAFRMLFGGRKKNVSQQSQDPGELPASDVLMEDPVCGSLVPKQQAVTLQENDTTHYFCSEACRKAFVDNKGEQG